VGDSWEEYAVFHHNFITWLKINKYDVDEVRQYSEKELNELVKKSPYNKSTSNDVDWVKKVQMQGAIQKWVDHSISVTVNLPKTATEEIVSKVYEEGWKSGCKGITVYRDGSRSGVLISNETKENEKISRELKRPKKLRADVVRFYNNNEQWIAFIGLMEGRPYEIFTGIADEDAIHVPKTISKGYILKNKDENEITRYDFQYTNKMGYKTTIEGLSHKFDKEFWNYAKLFSSVLRYGMPIPDVVTLVSSLQLDSDNINTWKNGVERALKRYIANGTKAHGQKCKNCNSESLLFQEGCLICTDCGSSECG
jgi:ribonucleoside-diphosphate reductase alpha chain